MIDLKELEERVILAAVSTSETDMAERSLDELKELAKVRGLKGTSTMKKAELVEAMLAEDERLKKEEEAKAAEQKQESATETVRSEEPQKQERSERPVRQERNYRPDRNYRGESVLLCKIHI